MAADSGKVGVLLLLSGAVGFAIWWWRRRTAEAMPVEDLLVPEAVSSDPLSPATPANATVFGWKGDPIERPRVHDPIFESTPDGRRQFVGYTRNALINLGFTHEQALLFIAHLARETGWGKWIWDKNVGNIKTGSTLRGPYFIMTDARGHTDKYRAYDTPEDGIFDNVNLIRKLSRYAKSWSMLMAADPNWYGQLGLDGYYEGPRDPANPARSTRHTPETVAPVQSEYNSILRSVRNYDVDSAG